MEILPHEGLSPGSMAVLEIWPPYSCSPIHNHGHAYGLIKILSGQVRVQNFKELTFDDFTAKPYL
jgi:predicted metal-dependent enzyme (double-stranded beta helix superfamily)